MNKKLLEKLKKMEVESPILFAPAASEAEIGCVEASLQSVFSMEYKEFLKIYGGAMPGPYPVFGINPIDLMDKRLNTVEIVTQYFRRQGWPKVDDGSVISCNHAGDPIILKNDGTVFMESHDGFGDESWNSFDDFLIWCINR